MFGRRIPFNQIAFATLVGVVGGIYVYKPFFEPPTSTSSSEPHLDVVTHEPGDQRPAAAKQEESSTVHGAHK
ncbi:protein PIGBOS1 [Chanos chanos]|uniref:Protein PIGBOS1 n=1 Tax=Chanos chanos TaxID=29144 RepID=A0A6J2URJ6_CHACN|nr:protein PIGBOS1 [Chanos chanos]XP_030622685.1 protein PIGBOS1 [Chanos chanos]